MENCLFCKIAAGAIPAEKIYENKHVIAFLDINPVNPGHTLIVPKAHYPTLYETPDEELAAMVAASKKIAVALKKMGADGVNLGMNNDGAAGQVVMHAHMHVMPRRGDDGFRLWHGKSYAEGEAFVVAEKIRNTLL